MKLQCSVDELQKVHLRRFATLYRVVSYWLYKRWNLLKMEKMLPVTKKKRNGCHNEIVAQAQPPVGLFNRTPSYDCMNIIVNTIQDGPGPQFYCCDITVTAL